MNKPTEEGHMDPREVSAVRPAMPQRIIGRRAQISEEVRLATGRPQARHRCRTQMRLGDVIPQTGVMRIKEEIVPATRTGKIRSSYRRAMTLKLGIHEMQRQWLHCLNLWPGPWKLS